MLATILKQPCIWYCRTFNPFQKNPPLCRALKGCRNNRNTVSERMNLQHNLCSLYGLCPSISEYLTTPEEINHTITMWLRCAGKLKKKKKEEAHIPGFNWCKKKHLYHKINTGWFKDSPNRNITFFFFFLCWFPGEIDVKGEPALGDTEMTRGRKNKKVTDELHLYRSSLLS